MSSDVSAFEPWNKSYLHSSVPFAAHNYASDHDTDVLALSVCFGALLSPVDQFYFGCMHRYDVPAYRLQVPERPSRTIQCNASVSFLRLRSVRHRFALAEWIFIIEIARWLRNTQTYTHTHLYVIFWRMTVLINGEMVYRCNDHQHPGPPFARALH